jgi:precorrin-4 methylase
MTYKEAYTNCKTFEELETMVKHDSQVAIFLNPDRIQIIINAMNEVCLEKGWNK